MNLEQVKLTAGYSKAIQSVKLCIEALDYRSDIVSVEGRNLGRTLPLIKVTLLPKEKGPLLILSVRRATGKEHA
jgi:hypothetical protein